MEDFEQLKKQRDELLLALQEVATALEGYPGGWANDVQKCLWDGTRKRALERIAAATAGYTPAAANAARRTDGEAEKLAKILWGMCEGGGEERSVDIYADDYQAGDGDTYVHRAGELLVEQAAEIVMLVQTVDLLGNQLADRAPAAAAAALPTVQTWQERGNADNWQQPHNVYHMAESADLRAAIARRATAGTTAAPSGEITNWLRRNANAERDPMKRAAFIEAHNAAREIERATAGTTAAPSGEPDRDEFERECLRYSVLDDEGLNRNEQGDYVDDVAQAAWGAWKLCCERATAGNAAPTDENQWIDRLSYDAQVDEWAIERSNLESEIESLKAQLATPAATAAPGDLPPLPSPAHYDPVLAGKTGTGSAYTPHQVREIQREAYDAGWASQLPRVRHLEHERDSARACIASNAGAAIPEGFKLVPVEPTQEMISAGLEGLNLWDRCGCGAYRSPDEAAVYRAMLAAAPSDTSPAGARRHGRTHDQAT